MWMFLGPKISEEFNKYVGKPLDKKGFEETAKKMGFKKAVVSKAGKGSMVYNPYRITASVDTEKNTVIGFHKG